MPATAWLHTSKKIYFIKLDISGHFTYVNNYFASSFSFLGEHLRGESGDIVVHPRDYEAYHSALDKCFENTGDKNTVLLRMVKEGGGCFLTEWEFSASFDENGNPVGVAGIGFNTTEASLSQLRLEMKLQSLQMLSDSSTDGILLLDKNYKILAYNKPAENMSLELYKKQYLPGDDFRKYLRRGAEDVFHRQFDAALVGEVNEEGFDITKKDGTTLCLKVQMTPVYDDTDETVSGVAILTRDVTIINDLNSRLNNVSALQSHQIRRPVANMMSLLDLINSERLDERDKEYLRLLRISIDQLDEEIRQIVAAARKG